MKSLPSGMVRWNTPHKFYIFGVDHDESKRTYENITQMQS